MVCTVMGKPLGAGGVPPLGTTPTFTLALVPFVDVAETVTIPALASDDAKLKLALKFPWPSAFALAAGPAGPPTVPTAIDTICPAGNPDPYTFTGWFATIGLGTILICGLAGGGVGFTSV